MFDAPPSGWWSNNICKIDNAEIIKGSRKCKPKNLGIVGSPTTKPPHNITYSLAIKKVRLL